MGNQLNLIGSITVAIGGEIVLKLDQVPSKTIVMISATYQGFVATGVSPMAYTLPNDKNVDVAVSYLDAKGNVVDIATGSVTWDTSNVNIVDVSPRAGDDQTATLMPGTILGTAQVTCTAKNPDGSEVIATMDVNVVAGNAVTGVIAPVEIQPIKK